MRNLHAKVDSKPADIPSDGGDPCPRTPSEPSLLPAAEPRRCDIDLDRLTALGRGAAQIVHELNLPASLISGSLESLDHLVEILMGAVREGGPSHPEGAPAAREEVAYAIEHAPEVLRICRDGVARLTRLVGELRSLVNGPAPVPAPTPVDVARIVEDAVSSVAFAGRGSPVPHVQIHRGPDPEIALGCAGLLERAFANLIANAFEAVQACADARVSVAIADGPARPAGGGAPSIEITIRDNGPGIPREHRERIFEAFFTTKGRGGGMGLGLAITRDIVVGHGGEIGVAEAPPPGTAVIVRLPRARCA